MPALECMIMMMSKSDLFEYLRTEMIFVGFRKKPPEKQSFCMLHVVYMCDSRVGVFDLHVGHYAASNGYLVVCPSPPITMELVKSCQLTSQFAPPTSVPVV